MTDRETLSVWASWWNSVYYGQYAYLYVAQSSAAEVKARRMLCRFPMSDSVHFLDSILFCSLTVSYFFPRSCSLSSFRHFNQPCLITDTLGVTRYSFTCHLWEMEPRSRRQKRKTRSWVSHGCWNRPCNSMDMTPGTLLDCQLASPIVPAGSLL